MAVKYVAALQTATLQEDMTDSDGNRIPKGTVVIVLPQTVADAVIFADGQSMAEVRANMETALAGYQNQLTRLASRLTGAGF